MHSNRHPKEFWFGPDMSIELYLLVKTLSIKGWNYRNCFQLVHYVAPSTSPTPLPEEVPPRGKSFTPQRIASNEAKEATTLSTPPPHVNNHSGPRGKEFPWTMRLWPIPEAWDQKVCVFFWLTSTFSSQPEHIKCFQSCHCTKQIRCWGHAFSPWCQEILCRRNYISFM